ncbi:MAG: hypothetical protein NTV94_14190 [Planctomycetota bacterium]|nr:hypothetical protein [Planctomycetota bacterium]
MSGLYISRGSCTVLFAYDIGFGISLDRAERMLASSVQGKTQREYLRHARKSPQSFEYRPSPLRFTRKAAPVAVGACSTDAAVSLTLYDFGAVSVAYTIPLEGTLDQLAALSEQLYDNKDLAADSRNHASELLRDLHGAVVKPGLLPMVEDYVIFHAQEYDCQAATATEFIAAARESLAGILRAERMRLSAQEVGEATESVVSYTPSDAAVIDWNATLLLGPDMQDVLAVLEFANVELLEMRFLDEQLDRALERAYAATAKKARAFLTGGSASLREVAGLQVDSSLLFETVNNTLKLVGDQHLARVYQTVAKRFHLPEWDANILRKLGTLEGLYEKLNDRQTTRRMEVLEWIIILLIAFEVVATWVWPLVKTWVGVGA